MHMTSEYSGLANGVLYTLHNFVDASDDMATIINTIKSKQASGDYESAAAYISTPEVQALIKKSVITAEIINAIEEEIRNTEIKALSEKQQIFYSSDASTSDLLETGDIWIGGLEAEEI